MARYNTDRLNYHKATSCQQMLYDRINGILKSTAIQLDLLLPEGQDKTLVFHQLEVLKMLANKAVALEDIPMFIGEASEEASDPWV